MTIKQKAETFIDPKVLRRFFVKIEPQKQCWPWLGALAGSGYASSYNGKRVMQASRYVYGVFYGDIPADFTVDHLCFNKACVNPWHLEAVSIGENVRRGNSVIGGRTRLLLQAQKRIDIPLKAFLIANRDSGKSYPELSRELGVSSGIIAYWCKKLHISKGGIAQHDILTLTEGNFHRKVLPSQVLDFRNRYGDWTLQQIGTTLGISRERVRQILKREGLKTRHEKTAVAR